MGLRDALLDAWALVMPVECAGCGDPGRALCAACAAHLVPLPVMRSTPGGISAVTALRYEDVVRRVILSLKEQHRTDVAAALARPLAAALSKATPPGSTVEFVPVPGSRDGYRRRGYHPVVLLLRKAGHAPSRVLRTRRRTSTQKTLGVADRAANLSGAFAARRPLGGRTFLIVDDVLTTGATLDEAARALSEAGGTVVGAVALAFTPRLFAFRDNVRGEDYGGAKGAQ
jgi:ComF family protein